ncbi:MAG: hypothetical protein DHS20C19_21570 [Acidimicrobiales bacterium]|nr:MAG: hypothetical protein DHS20C19_21570 [Acidimicrobiales bacterium]
MFVLGAIVIDVSLTHVRGDELESVAGSAANDALAGLDLVALRSGDGVQIDVDRATTFAEAGIAAGALPEAELTELTVGLDGQGRTVISVTLELSVDLVMAPAVGDLDSVTLRRTRSATILGSDLP